MTLPPSVTFGVDIGGTFTDVVAFDAAGGRLATGKVLTDYQDLARGVMTGIRSVMADAGIAADTIRRVVHGTTLVTNSLIERRGVPTALVTTAGFGDVLEFARESRYNIYDIDLAVTPPIVPRDLVFEIDERMDHHGRVLRPPADGAGARLAGQLRAAGIESVAVCLLHAYANPSHEQQVAQELARRLPGVDVCLSSEVMPDVREYERATTTAANAYVRPVIRGYLRRLRRALDELGIRTELLIMTSDGGLVDVETAARFPVRLTESGPAGGATAAAFIGGQSGVPDLIAYDMGGTTAKVCVIEGGAPLKSNSFEFGRSDRFARGSGLPLQIPVVEMIEIGAGGGSIAHVNEIGMLQIGPHSANAAPGPACYGLGGEYATVTDADLVLGYLAADSFLGGTMRLDVAAARAAIDRSVARPLGLSIEEAACSIHRVVNANMARAAKVHCLEQGKDARRFALFPYGGAGPVHAYGVARLLGAGELIYPLRAGVLSAFGFLVADPSFEVLRGGLVPLDDADPAALDALLDDMAREAERVVRASVPDAAHFAVERAVAVRYRGQSFELYVPVDGGTLDTAGIASIAGRFTEAYAARYHQAGERGGLEAVRWRVRVTAADPGGKPRLAAPGGNAGAARRGQRDAWVPEAGGFRKVPVYDRYALAAGTAFDGPAIVEETESAVFIGAGARASIDALGSLRVALDPVRAA
ncbi:hydantoinase/oxoprolinase family protein [Pigmentiphaga soli]|uniref:Hydantoinase/oxoprolinase family protein n=1 Tax=Pigmentiphaga soli TaxID=1007095 RepID=A0ABP8HMS8_9BURK